MVQPIAETFVEIGADVRGLTTGLRVASRSVTDFGKKVTSLGKNLSIKVTLPILALGVASVKSAADLETLEVAFESMLGSAEAASKVVKDLIEFTARTPFQLAGVGQAAKQLLAFGVASDDLLGVLKTLGDISAGANVPLAEMAAIFGKVKAKGKAMTEELLQLSDRGIPIIAVLAEKLEVSKEEIFKMAAAGEISFPVLVQAFQSMTTASGIFANQMEKQSKTLAGLFSTLRDNVSLALAEIGKEIVKTTNLKVVFDDLTRAIQRGITAFKQLTPETRAQILVVAGLIAALGPLLVVLGLIITSVSALLGALVAAAPAFAAMAIGAGGAVAALAPLIAGILVVGAALVSVGLLVAIVIRNWDRLGIAAQQLGDIIVGAFEFAFKGTKAFLVDGSKSLFDRFITLLGGPQGAVVTFVKGVGKVFKELGSLINKFFFQPFIKGIDFIIDGINKLLPKSKELEKFGDLKIEPGKAILAGLDILGEEIVANLEVTRTKAGEKLDEITVEFERLGDDLKRVGGEAAGAFTDEFEAVLRDFGITDVLADIPGQFGSVVDGMKTKLDELTRRFLNLGSTVEDVNTRVATSTRAAADTVSAANMRIAAAQDTAREAFAQWAGITTTALEDFQNVASDVFQSFTAGLGDVVARVIVDGESLADGLRSLMQNIARIIISSLVRIAIQRAIQAAIGASAAATQAAAETVSGAQRTFAGQFAAMSAAPFPINLTAPAVASSMLALFRTGVAAAGGIAAMAAGGIVTGPTLALVGEAGPEAVIPLDRGGGMFAGMKQVIQILLDGTVIGEAAAENLPEFLSVNAGIDIT